MFWEIVFIIFGKLFKILKYVFCIGLLIWSGFACYYNIFVSKDYILALLWFGALMYPISLLYKISS